MIVVRDMDALQDPGAAILLACASVRMRDWRRCCWVLWL
jgi:hypothetical protein